MVGFPISHPKMIIMFSRKTPWVVGETHHFKETSIWILFACVGPFRPTQRIRWFQGKVVQRQATRIPPMKPTLRPALAPNDRYQKLRFFFGGGTKNGVFSQKVRVLFPWWTYFAERKSHKTRCVCIACEIRYLKKSYCWWTKSCTAWYVSNLVNKRINYLSTGAGFCPSTVFQVGSWYFASEFIHLRFFGWFQTCESSVTCLYLLVIGLLQEHAV